MARDSRHATHLQTNVAQRATGKDLPNEVANSARNLPAALTAPAQRKARGR